MTRFEEKLYLQSVFNVIDEVYKFKNHKQVLTYEERLRASFNKLLVPNWFNRDYTSNNGLRKTKSHGQVFHTRRYDFNNNKNNETYDSLTSSSTSNDTHRYRSQSQSWSERRPIRHDSAASSYDTNGSVIINSRRLINSNGTSTYAPGLQRVTQSSTWYKPKTFTINEHTIDPPKPLPRHMKKIDQERLNLTDSSSSLFKYKHLCSISNENVRYPIESEIMAQNPISTDDIDEETYLVNVSLDTSSDSDIIMVHEPLSLRVINDPSLNHTPISPTHQITNDTMTHTMLTNISQTYLSNIEANLPSLDKNLLITDSSSYISVNEPCSSASTSSYHTALASDTSMNGYKTPTPQLDDETLSSHSSISDLSHTETLEPHPEDLDIVAVSTREQKSAIILPVNVGMENLPLPPFSATISNTSSSSVSDNSPSTESRLLENTNWYDEGSIETCIHESTLPQVSSIELREIANEEILHEVDVNGIGDEFFLFSPHNTTDDEPSSSLSDDKHEQELIQIESPIKTSKNLYKMNEKNSNLNDDDDLRLTEEFQNLKDLNSFGFNNSNNNNSSLMITDLDDLLNEDDDDDHLKDSPNYLSNSNYRRPIQEDILYEVEHENSYSDHSQNTSSIITADDKASIKADPNLDFLTSTKEPMENDIHHHSSFIETSLQDRQSKPNELTSSLKQTINDNSTLPIYILPPVDTTTKETSSSLHIDTYNNPFSDQWNSYERRYPDLTSPSYTPKIRHRHFSVGSYYDNKTTTVAIHPNHTFFILGSAPVSPLARSSTANHDSHYYVQHHSPISYETIAYNALRHINPFLDTDPYLSPYGYQRPSPSLNKDDSYQTVTSYSEQQTMPIIQTEPTSVVSTRVVTFPEGEEEKEKEKEEEIPNILPKMASTSSPLASSSSSSSSSPPPHQFAQVPPLVRPKTSRGRPRTPPPPPPPRTISLENDDSQNIYHEIDSTSTDDDQTTAPNDDLKFIRGTIERVFDFNGETASEISTNRDEISEDIKNDDDDDESISLSNGTKTVSKKANQYPAVEAVQRFYQNKTPSDSEKNKPNKQPVDIDVTPISHHSSTSNKLYARSHPRNARKKESSPSKSTDTEQVTSEEVDDTLNDIEDDDYQDDKMKRQATNNSSRTSNETSPVHSSDNQIKVKKTSQETQTLQRQKPIILTTQSPSGSQSTIQSYETACSNIPPLDIVTQMVIERTDGIDDGQIGEITGDMIIYYDDIEIVEHPSNLSSTESESTSTYSKPIKNAKPVRTIIETTAPPPIPARTLKPVHLLSNNHHHHHHHHQQSPSPLQNEPVTSSTTKINRIYELEKSTIRKKFDVNTVNNMLNRTEHNVGSNGTHRLPSARHFVGKINSDDTSSHNSSISSPKILTKPLPTSTMVKSQTLPLQPTTTNGHSRTNILHSPTKSPYSTLPVRSSSSVGTNNNRHQSVIADTNALVKQIQNSLSRNSLHDIHNTAPLSISTKDLRTFVSSTYSPSDENMIDDDGVIHVQHQKSSYHDEQAFKRQARLSKSFHNVSEYNSSDQYPKKENHFTSRTQPSKSVENNLNQVTQKPIRNTQMILNFPPIVASTSFAALPHSEDNARMLSMKWYTGQVSENSEICYNTSHMDNDDLLYGYITRHSNPESQLLLARLQASNDIRIHAALDDIRLRVAQFDASKSPDDLHIFIRYLESRLRDISNKNSGSLPATLNRNEGQKRITNGGTTNGYHTQKQQPDVGSIKSRTSSIVTGTSKETSPLQRQVGRQHLRSSGNIATVGGETNGHPTSRPPPPPRRSSQTSINQENPAVFDDMLNTVLGLPKKGVRSQTPTNSSSFQNRDKSTPLTQTQMPTNNTSTGNKTGRDVGKRLFESGTYKDPRLIYDGSQKNEKEEEPLETSV